MHKSHLITTAGSSNLNHNKPRSGATKVNASSLRRFYIQLHEQWYFRSGRKETTKLRFSPVKQVQKREFSRIYLAAVPPSAKLSKLWYDQQKSEASWLSFRILDEKADNNELKGFESAEEFVMIMLLVEAIQEDYEMDNTILCKLSSPPRLCWDSKRSRH